jgi:hypothetical protein
VVAA